MDTLSALDRSRLMASVRGKHTQPERLVRSLLHRAGYRFRLHAKLPGSPDIIFSARKRAIFVHGCFWHAHRNCRRATTPTSNREFWTQKLAANRLRDKKALAALKKLGWKSLIVWECETRDTEGLKRRLFAFLSRCSS